MSDPSHQQLLGHLLGALDDDEQDWLESRLERDVNYRRQWAQWCRRIAPLEALRPDFEPPPGLAQRTCRYVAAHRAGKIPSPPPNLSTGEYLSGSASQLGWSDVLMLTVLVVLAIGIVIPAIYGSRLQTRLAACQDRLQKVGLALSDYSVRKELPLTRLANDGRLTPAGAAAAALLEAQFTTDQHPAVPEAWLAAQGMPSRNQGRLRVSDNLATPLYGPQTPPIGEAVLRAETDSRTWPGIWRDGTTNGPSTTSPADLALLADAPSVLPGQTIEYHGGLGRNLFYADGHVKVLPCAALDDQAELIDLRSHASSPVSSLPTTFVNFR